LANPIQNLVLLLKKIQNFQWKKAFVMVAAPNFSSHFEEILHKRKRMIHMPHDQCFSFWGGFLHFSDKTNLV
jgi:hypothetical protein